MSERKFDPELKEAFLQMLEDVPNFTVVRRLFGIGSTAFYAERARDPEWSEALKAAREAGYDMMEEEARRRAVDGWVEPVFYQGEQVTDANGNPVGVRKYSDSLLQFLLKHSKPRKFNPGVRVTAQTDDKVQFKFVVGPDTED